MVRILGKEVGQPIVLVSEYGSKRLNQRNYGELVRFLNTAGEDSDGRTVLGGRSGTPMWGRGRSGSVHEERSGPGPSDSKAWPTSGQARIQIHIGRGGGRDDPPTPRSPAAVFPTPRLRKRAPRRRLRSREGGTHASQWQWAMCHCVTPCQPTRDASGLHLSGS